MTSPISQLGQTLCHELCENCEVLDVQITPCRISHELCENCEVLDVQRGQTLCQNCVKTLCKNESIFYRIVV